MNELDKAIARHSKLFQLDPDKIYSQVQLQKVLSVLKEISYRAYYLSSENKNLFLSDIAESLLFIYRITPSENPVQRQIVSSIEEIILSSTLFTIDIGTHPGFTEQLLLFSMYYKLGKLAGMNYIHTDFYSPRSSEKIYDFLGFNSYWENNINSLKDRESIKKIYFDVSLKSLEDREINSLTDLIKNVKTKVISQYEVDRRLVLVFPKVGDAKQKLLNLVNRVIPYFPDGLNLRHCYFAKHESNLEDTSLAAEPHTVQTLIHIRLGDIGIIKSPWNSFIRVQQGQIKETTDFPKNRVSVQDFYKVVDFFSKNSKNLKMSFSLFSDGYNLTFENIIKSLKLANEADKVNKIEKQKNLYENEEFKAFSSLDLNQKHIGETDENLFKLIDCSLKYRIIITSIHQRMMPKLISLFPNEFNKHILIILSTSNHLNFRSLTELGLSSEKAHIFNINVIENLESQIEPIIEFISSIRLVR